MGDYLIGLGFNVKALGIASIANGIMARHFYASFGKDAISAIGNDTLVNPIELLRVTYSATKELEKRTEKIEGIEKENAQLKIKIEKQNAKRESLFRRCRCSNNPGAIAAACKFRCRCFHLHHQKVNTHF